MKRKVLTAAIIVFLLYVGSYLVMRQTNAEIWEQDGRTYVIFSADKIYLYYLYRPISWIDGSLTGMRFHIGRH